LRDGRVHPIAGRGPLRTRRCRYRRGSIIATTNREPKELYPLSPDPVLAEGLLDRLVNSAHVLTLLGRSYRPRQRPTHHRE
ncbi:MAG: ATP-binding protein, partial [Chloroflexota bacterium]|nr:ATP-binding protein [Chloroflexota bacterium]